MILYYENSRKEKVNFMSDPIFCEEPEALAVNEWNYEAVININNSGRVKRFYKDPVERKLRISVVADSDAEFNEITNRLHDVFEYDIRNKSAGKMHWNDYVMECFISAETSSEFDEHMDSVEVELTVLTVYPFWVKEIEHKFFAITESTNSTGLDYPHDYAHDLNVSGSLKVMHNNTLGMNNFQIAFFGPCESPFITIGGHTYELNDIEIDEGQYATINSINKKVILHRGTSEENIFSHRGTDDYVFEPIPNGDLPVIFSTNTVVTIYDERGIPVWI